MRWAIAGDILDGGFFRCKKYIMMYFACNKIICEVTKEIVTYCVSFIRYVAGQRTPPLVIESFRCVIFSDCEPFTTLTRSTTSCSYRGCTFTVTVYKFDGTNKNQQLFCPYNSHNSHLRWFKVPRLVLSFQGLTFKAYVIIRLVSASGIIVIYKKQSLKNNTGNCQNKKIGKEIKGMNLKRERMILNYCCKLATASSRKDWKGKYCKCYIRGPKFSKEKIKESEPSSLS